MNDKWIEGNPPNNIFFNVYWVRDDKHIFLARWEDQTWMELGLSFFRFVPEDVTHYCELYTPDDPIKEEVYAYA